MGERTTSTPLCDPAGAATATADRHADALPWVPLVEDVPVRATPSSTPTRRRPGAVSTHTKP
jgi:hypothetical protein